MDDKPMRILLIEDDELQCQILKEYVETRNDINIVGITNSSKDAIEIVKNTTPEGIILDIELHRGQGSGIEFIEEVKEQFKEFKPIIIVTTNSASDILYNKLHEEGVDLIFYKQQENYSIKSVISALISLRKTLYKYKDSSNNKLLMDTPAEIKNKISNKINNELDLIGISSHLKGREYIHDAILFLIEEDNKKNNDTVFNYLANMHRKSSSSISRVMQTAINYAWRTSAPEELEIHYNAKINYNTGVPSTTEFIYYYANKLKKII